ncbi:MAG: type II toxin-antitoxin system RelE/ParE family toxin [Candidatus Adiutrix sp.]|jgi:mRNA-degrading endonuclease RelE of RelBE toxin-antitoxin system|nr:type II toxin-antitoxin system RelE/ParE family toxin [Candidatus Adiutrix sp.]
MDAAKNKIEWTNKALKQMLKLPAPASREVLAKVKTLSAWPEVSGVIKLVNGPEYRLRVGRYRVIFNVYPGEKVTVLQIEEVLKRNERTYS